MKRGGMVVIVPYPAQGHIGPMQKLASALLSQGLEPVIVLPQYLHSKKENDNSDDGIKWVAVADGLEQVEDPDFFAIESAMENIMPSHLEELLLLMNSNGSEELGGKVVCVVADLLASWAIQVAGRCGIPAAGYWPAMLSTYRLISSIPLFLRTGLISHSGLPQHEGKIRLVPDLPTISTDDLPWLIGTVAAKKARFKFWIRNLERSRGLKWLLVNSFPDESMIELQSHQLSNNTIHDHSQGGYPRVFPISPICCNHHQLTNKNLSLWEEDTSCLTWLESHKAGSVVYISFGSWVSPIGELKVKNLALALEASKRPFIWVLKPNWRQGLPIGFVERVFMQGIGMVVSWAPQAEILQHEAVGCYITHCGWNSTLEALQCMKRMLCYPVAGDQFLNCAYVVQVWRVGLRLNGLGLKDIEDGLARVMEDEEMGDRLMGLHEGIMGMKGDNARGASMLKAFVDGLMNEVASATNNIMVHEYST